MTSGAEFDQPPEVGGLLENSNRMPPKLKILCKSGESWPPGPENSTSLSPGRSIESPRRIASHAVTQGSTLITNDLKHFSSVSGLKVELINGSIRAQIQETKS
jgi:hypothetical protein